MKLRAEMKLLEPELPQTALSPQVDDNFGYTAALVMAIYQDPAKAAEEAVRGERANTVALGIGMALVILCLVLQYNSAAKPLLIPLTVPLSIIGGLLGLWLRVIPFGFMETLCFQALFGTVLNVAISLIGEKLKIREGLAAEGERSYCGLTRNAFRAALVEASQVRLLPIFMTSASTVAGLTSLMLGGGPLFKGLTTFFAVGLIAGSTITLFVLPSLMALFVENFRFNWSIPATDRLPDFRPSA